MTDAQRPRRRSSGAPTPYLRPWSSGTWGPIYTHRGGPQPLQHVDHQGGDLGPHAAPLYIARCSHDGAHDLGPIKSLCCSECLPPHGNHPWRQRYPLGALLEAHHGHFTPRPNGGTLGALEGWLSGPPPLGTFVAPGDIARVGHALGRRAIFGRLRGHMGQNTKPCRAEAGGNSPGPLYPPLALVVVDQVGLPMRLVG